MISIEERVKQLETEVRHLTELDKYKRQMLDAHEDRMNRVDATLIRITDKLEVLTDNMINLTSKFDKLITTLTREHKNGGNS